MLMRLFDSNAMSAAERALTGLSRRQESIASNIANIDTPGYQRKDVSFEDSLRSMLSGGDGSPEMTMRRTNSHHIEDDSADAGLGIGMPSGIGGSGGGSGGERDLVSMRNDNNTVGVDEEMTRLVETQMRYQALSQSLGSRISTLRTVIRGT